MTPDLIIWLGITPSAPWGWFATPSECGTAITDADKSALAARGARQIAVILPGQSVRILPHDLPELRASERAKAAAFAVEDQLAAPVDSQHIVLGNAQRLAVVASDVMADAIEAMKVCDLTPQAIFADFDVVPEGVGAVGLPDRIITPGKEGHTLDRDWANMGEPAQVYELFSVLENLEFENAINLATGAFAQKKRLNFAGLDNAGLDGAWLRRVAIWGAMCGVTWLAWQSVHAKAILAQAKDLRAETARLYTEATGETSTRPARDITRAIKSTPDHPIDVITLSSALFTTLAAQPGVEVDALQYDAANGGLNLRLTYPDFESATQLEQRFSGTGVVFQSGGVRDQQGRTVGEAFLRLGGKS